ncbi:Phosphatidate cytidylyltransferase, putative [Thermococcus gammatolerans EJ3]|uniref:Phosphatidate cytidylyltransferase, putative n=1 Tax=Thermococcus gammatolerans (strain DSM 15229 / JCM 11827 / EJ3) TaxID=593117 RepID=C5A4W9_THEGJ|nr:Phosphatidate cytidylyltransferase, putative [Thermococcus gammatolerans EJ3]
MSKRELIRKLWHVSPGILGAPIILFTPRWVTLLVVWSLAFLYTLQHLKLRRGWKFTVPIAELSYRTMAREDERDNFLGSFLFWVTMGIICTVFPKLMALSALWVSTFGDCFNAITGQALGGPRIPWNRKKTLIGSATMFIVSVLVLWTAHSVLSLDPSWSLITGVALVATALESLPLRSAYDEFTVPFATAFLLWLAYGGSLLSPVW